MTLQEFQQQMGRLIEQFGKNAYSQARAELIWREVKELTPRWWEETVDKLLGECRQAPLMTDFREEISKERERLWRIEKKQNEKDAKEFFHSSYAPDDVRTICQTIVKRLQGGVSDEDYASFQKMLNNVAASNPESTQKVKCKPCDDSGLVFKRDENNYEFVYRCSCPRGAKQPKGYPIFQH